MKLFALVATALAVAHPNSDLLTAEDGKAVYLDGEKHFQVGYTLTGEGDDQKVELASDPVEVVPVTRFALVGREQEAFTVLQGIPREAHEATQKELEATKATLADMGPKYVQALYDVGVRKGTLMPSGKEGYLAKGAKDPESLRKLAYEGPRVIPAGASQPPSTTEHTSTSPAQAQTGGKKWEDMSNMEREALHKSDREAFNALHADYQTRLAKGEVKKTAKK